MIETSVSATYRFIRVIALSVFHRIKINLFEIKITLFAKYASRICEIGEMLSKQKSL